ncbi:MAG: hypothetical protein F4Z52_00080 [Gammaproteobacteria bacterium]|nr:hypothetical protein [Gammaproteobacteria bacterium]
MSKEKDSPSVDDEFDLFDEDEALESDVDLDLLEEGTPVEMTQGVANPAPNGTAARRTGKLETRRRLTAYFERKWFRDLGWDDDDELFNDEFFTDTSGHLHHSI